MTIDAYTLSFISGGLAIVGVLIGAWATYRLSLHLAKTQADHAKNLSEAEAFRHACSKLRAAFAPELGELRILNGAYFNEPRPRKIEENHVVNMLSKAFPRHSTAIEEFRSYISREDMRAYQVAWENYYKGGFEDYDEYNKNLEFFILFQERVDAIFRFAPL